MIWHDWLTFDRIWIVVIVGRVALALNTRYQWGNKLLCMKLLACNEALEELVLSNICSTAPEAATAPGEIGHKELLD